MKLSDLQDKFLNELKHVDDTAQIILKGHLVIEDLMNESIKNFVFHAENIEEAKLQFHQKILLCKSMSTSNNKHNMWNLLKHINNVRNSLSHSLDKDRRNKVIKALQSNYDQEFDKETRSIKGLSDEAGLCIASIVGVLGFLHSFSNEIKRFKEIILTMDKLMNKGELNNKNKK
uniref:hypothetical protein n=1 Tax=Aliarcobacter sp. TaxID=2321116 RepID=UPI004047FF57